MMLLSRSFPSRKHGGIAVMATRRLNARVFTVLLLVLSQNVWSTFQCVTSSSQPRNQQLLTQEQDVEKSGNFGNGGPLFSSSFTDDEIFQGTSTGEGADTVWDDNSGFEKRGQQGQVSHSPHMSDCQEIRLCGYRLVNCLLKICGANNFYDPSSQENFGMARKQSSRQVMQRRFTRSLADDCCNNPCNASTLVKFCHRMPVRTVDTQISNAEVEMREPEGNKEQDSDVMEFVQPAQPLSPDNGVQLAPTSPSTTPHPVVQALDFLQLLFSRKSHPRLRPAAEEDIDGDSNSEQKRDFPFPQARIQPEQNGPHHHHQQQPHLPKQLDVADADMEAEQERNTINGAGVSFNTNTALPNGHDNTINTAIGGGDSFSFDQPANNHVHSPKIKNNFHDHHQGQSQHPRRVSSNVLTSTIAPHAIIMPLKPSTDDDGPYGKKK